MYNLSVLSLPIVTSFFVGLLVYELLSGKLKLLSDEWRMSKRHTSNFDENFQKLFPDNETREKIEKVLMESRSNVNRVIRYLLMGLSLLGILFFSSILLEPFTSKLPGIFGKLGSGLATIGVMFISIKSWSFQTWSGNSKAEKVKDAFLLFLWFGGIALVFFSE